MVRRFALLILILAFGGGALAGMPLHQASSWMMTCCDKAKSKEKTSEVKAAQLCCALNCNDSAPTSSSSTFNFSPSTIVISDSILKQIALLLKKKSIAQTVSFSFERKIFSQKFQPKYIQHHSFLI
jgi:hypothetical protein